MKIFLCRLWKDVSKKPERESGTPLLYALIGYIWYEALEEEQNFSMLIDLIDASETKEDDEDFQNPVDLLFEELKEKEPNHFAVRQYAKYKLAAGHTGTGKGIDL